MTTDSVIIFAKNGEFDCRMGGETLPAGSVPFAIFNCTTMSLTLIYQINNEDVEKLK